MKKIYQNLWPCGVHWMLSTHSMLEEASVSGLAEEGIEVSVSLNVFTILPLLLIQ